MIGGRKGRREEKKGREAERGRAEGGREESRPEDKLWSHSLPWPSPTYRM